MTGPAIDVKNISYAYKEAKAVDDISFSVAPGEILGFLGPNGAGKSTTIKMLTGQMPPQSGNIQILGQDISTERRAVQAEIGVCFEEKNLYLNMSARENLKFFAALFGLKNVDTSELLRRVDLADRADDRPKDFSKGMRQRLMIARALINSPKVLFLDEPTDGLDPASAVAIRGLIRAEALGGAAVLLTTHDMVEADQLSDRVAFLNEGKIVALDTPENLKLSHGKRSVRLRFRDGAEVRDEVVALDEDGTGEKLKAAVGAEGLMTIHTEEATLETIFIELTGRRLHQ